VGDRKPAIGVVENRYVFVDRGLGWLAWLQNEDHLVVLQGQRLGEAPLFLLGKGVLEIVAGAQRPVQVLLIRGQLGKAGIVIGDECR